MSVALCFEAEIRFWDLAERKLLRTVQGHSQSEFAFITSLAFSSDSKILASGSDDNTIMLWNVENGEAIYDPLTGHNGDVTAIVFSPDGRLLASTDGGTIKIWEVDTGNHALDIVEEEPIRAIAFDLEGQTLTSATGKRVAVWDVDSGDLLREHAIGEGTIQIQSVALSPDAKLLAAGDINTHLIIWDLQSGEPIAKQPNRVLASHSQPITRIVFSSDGKMVATGSPDKTIILWNVEAVEPLRAPMLGHTDIINDFAFSPDGRALVSCAGDVDGFSLDNRVIIWELNQESFGQSIVSTTNSAMGASPSGGMLAFADAENSIMLWNLQSNESSYFDNVRLRS